ncbi:hypothetical protein IL306_015300, partial [Fusarium sp. DS 682]
MIDQLLKKPLDITAKDTARALKESTEPSMGEILPAYNVLTVLVRSVVVQALGCCTEIGQMESDVAAVAAAFTVDAFSGNAESQHS